MKKLTIKATMLLAGSVLLSTTLASAAVAQRGGGRAGAAISQGNARNLQVRSASTSNVSSRGRTNSNTDINRNVNRDVNVNHDVNVDVDVDHHYDWGDHYHPVARATAVAVTTAAVIGSYYRYLPANCATIYRGTIVYYQCGTAWYRPVYSGTTVQYIVVTTP